MSFPISILQLTKFIKYQITQRYYALLIGTAFIYVVEAGGFIPRALYWLAPLILSCVALLNILVIRNQIHIRLIHILISLWLIFVFLSFGVAQDKANAFGGQLLYLSGALFFVLGLHYQDKLRKPVIAVINIISIVLVLYFIAFSILPTSITSPLQHFHGYQFVYRYVPFLSHHPIGSFVYIPLLITLCSFLTEKKKIFIYTSVPLIAILITSLSRAGYAASTAGLTAFIFCESILRGKNMRATAKLLFIGIVLIITLLLVSASFNNPIRDAINVHNVQSEWKNVLNGRDVYLSASLESIRANPLLGIGTNHFLHAFMYIENTPFKTDTAHNLLLEIAVGNGLIALILYLLIIGVVLFQGARTYRNTSFSYRILFILFVAMLINFQFMYYYRIASHFCLFMLLGGIISARKSVPYKVERS